ncbi:MAG: hypothetical protein VXB01_06140, partial [Opitutae bacterium]
IQERDDKTVGLPTANEFRQKFRKNIGKDGKFKGDDTIYFQTKGYYDTGSSEKPNEDFEGEIEQSPKPEAVDPLTTLDPSTIPTERLQRDIQGQIIPIKKEEDEDIPDPVVGEPLPSSDLGYIDVTAPSDYTGGEASMATGPWANQTEMDRRMNAINREFEAGGRIIKYSEGGKDPNEKVHFKGKVMKRSEMEAMLAQGSEKPETISAEDLYKKYLRSRDKSLYMNQEGTSGIIKEQERIFKQRGNKFSDGTGIGDLFYNNGGKMKSYASGGKVLRYR